MINVSKLYCGLAGQSDELRYERAKHFGPVVVYNCTPRCNLRCRHCYSYTAQGTDELNTGEAKDLLAQLAEANAAVVLFSGGEPLMREDLFELLTEARRLGLRAVLSTNGTLIDSKTAKRISDVGVGYVGVSLDGERDFHNRFRNTEGCFEKAVEGIKNCQEVGLRTGLRFTITKSNLEQIPFAFEISESLGIGRVCFYHLIRTGRAEELGQQVPTAKQSRGVIDVILQKTKEYVEKGVVDEVLTVGNHCDGPYLLLEMLQEGNNDFETAKRLLLAAGGNKIGQKIVCVSWDGNVYADQFWRNYSLGNVMQKSFREIWESDEPVLKHLRDKDNFAAQRCLRCRWFPLCKGNYRFLGSDADERNWLNEPACYLSDDEIKK